MKNSLKSQIFEVISNICMCPHFPNLDRLLKVFETAMLVTDRKWYVVAKIECQCHLSMPELDNVHFCYVIVEKPRKC